jgi:hypothetical protein
MVVATCSAPGNVLWYCLIRYAMSPLLVFVCQRYDMSYHSLEQCDISLYSIYDIARRRLQNKASCNFSRTVLAYGLTRHLERRAVILSAAKDLFGRLARSFAALRMTARHPSRPLTGSLLSKCLRLDSPPCGLLEVVVISWQGSHQPTPHLILVLVLLKHTLRR